MTKGNDRLMLLAVLLYGLCVFAVGKILQRKERKASGTPEGASELSSLTGGVDLPNRAAPKSTLTWSKYKTDKIMELNRENERLREALKQIEEWAAIVADDQAEPTILNHMAVLEVAHGAIRGSRHE